MPLKKALFVGCARDCATTISYVLQNVSRIAGLFPQSAFVFLENDSRDTTKIELKRWCEGRQNARLISLDGLVSAASVRTMRLAIARNYLLRTACRDFAEFDVVLVVDCDEVNASVISLEHVTRAIQFLEQESCAAVFANQLGTYYDLWAFRHPKCCPGDVWEEVFDYITTHKVSDQQAFERTFSKHVFSLSPHAPPLRVDSAFGGLGIYKMHSILKNCKEYVGYKRKTAPPEVEAWLRMPVRDFGWQTCEHVSFHSGFRELGQDLYVLPFLINRNNGDSVTFSPSFWRSMPFDLHLVPSLAFDPEQPESWGKLSRNQPCPCGSGKRYKHCHGGATSTQRPV